MSFEELVITDEKEEIKRMTNQQRKKQNQKLIPKNLPEKGAYRFEFSNDERYDWRRRTTNWDFKKEFSDVVFYDEDHEDEGLKVIFYFHYIGFFSDTDPFHVYLPPNTKLGSILNCVLKQPIHNYFIANNYLLDDSFFDKTLNEVIERSYTCSFYIRVKDWYGKHHFKGYRHLSFDKLKIKQVLVKHKSIYKYLPIGKENRELIKHRNADDPPRVNGKNKLMINIQAQTNLLL